MKFLSKAVVMDKAQIRRTIMRIAHEIVEKNKGVENLILVGIRKRGVPLAERIAGFIDEFEGIQVPTGALDITLYRDDVQMIASNPVVGNTDIGTDISDRVVVLVDDVLFTGRTVRAALDELIDFGRPRAIRLAVLVDRGHREFPIRADFVGKNVPTASTETVKVLLKETDGEEKVILREVLPEAEEGPAESRKGKGGTSAKPKASGRSKTSKKRRAGKGVKDSKGGAAGGGGKGKKK